ncbi:CDP-alcohol phosphatidyltransferase family protein [Acidobacteriota bacterium]
MDKKPVSENERGHDRVNRSLISGVERKTLQWCAARTPPWMTPDRFTALGFSGALLSAASYFLSGIDRNFLWLASLGWLVNWFGDSMDGTLARFRKIERPTYGFYLDHSLDALSVVIIGLGLALSPYAAFSVGLLVLIGYLMLNIQLYIFSCATRVHYLSYGKLGATEFKIFACVFSCVLYAVGTPQMRFGTYDFMLWDPVFVCLACLMMLLVLIVVVKNAAALASLEKQKCLPKDI